ncbi:MAG TPA: phosphotransferase [Jiangellaceae bacterium]|nr:phosphotransferase [Jiangellaceae bacterium]
MDYGDEADLAVLTGPDAGELLGSAVDAMGGELLDWSTVQVDHRPGRGTAASYRARVRWPTGERTQTLGARQSARPLPDLDRRDVVRVSDGCRQVQVWSFPADPALPALSSMFDERWVAELLRSVGLPAAPATVKVIGYRPCRRAVLEITTPGSRLFVKALRPAVVEQVHQRHVLMRAAGLPTPRSLGWSDEGLLVLEPLPGAGLREAVRRHGAGSCSPDDLLNLLDRLPAELAELPRRPAWSESVDHYAEVLSAAAPGVGDQAHGVAVKVMAAMDSSPDDGPVHGDFYEAQLLVSGGRITGLLDADTAGPGRRVDDLACLVAHLSVLMTMALSTSAGVRAALTNWVDRFDRAVDPCQLRVRAAGVTLSLATGPYRTQESGWRRSVTDRIELAAQWLAAARTGGLPDLERPLTGASRPSNHRRRDWITASSPSVRKEDS